MLDRPDETTILDAPTHPGLREADVEALRSGAGMLLNGVRNRQNPKRLLNPQSDPSSYREEDSAAVMKRADARDQELADTQISRARSGADVAKGMDILRAHRERGEVEILPGSPYAELERQLKRMMR
ncbi:MAG: hypothetical protein ACI8RZ_001400 [Myxococcota bacterium]|jgi:hypothetical protein